MNRAKNIGTSNEKRRYFNSVVISLV